MTFHVMSHGDVHNIQYVVGSLTENLGAFEVAAGFRSVSNSLRAREPGRLAPATDPSIPPEKKRTRVATPPRPRHAGASLWRIPTAASPGRGRHPRSA